MGHIEKEDGAQGITWMIQHDLRVGPAKEQMDNP